MAVDYMTAAELLQDLKSKIDSGQVDPNKPVYVELYAGSSIHHQYEEGHHPYRTLQVYSGSYVLSTDHSDPEHKTYNIAVGT